MIIDMVLPHKKIRKNCKSCGIPHSANKCRFHKEGAFKETHGKYCTNVKHKYHSPKSGNYLRKKEPVKKAK